jgi:type III pantothenate kinase
MDINLMAVSVGNTRLALGTFVGGELRAVKRLPLESSADWAGAIAAAWEPLAGLEPVSVAGASVNPPVLEAVEHAIAQATGQSVEWVGSEIDLPIEVQTDQPQHTGVDRVLAVAAAYEQLGKACVVIDAGTAITINCCDDSGALVGGAILPGLEMQLAALHERTAKLPLVRFARPDGLVGRDTEQSILQGVYHGIRGAVKELVEQYAVYLGSWPEAIATGGDATALFEGWELIHAISPDLGLYGIALAYANHHIKHGEPGS